MKKNPKKEDNQQHADDLNMTSKLDISRLPKK